MKVGILGGGITGLATADFLRHPCEVLEKSSHTGGLNMSFHADGFTFDYGGHIMFSKDTEIRDYMVNVLGDNVKRWYRNNKIWYKKRFVKYPFENGLAVLPKEDIFECVYHYIFNDSPPPKNFREWIYHSFGKGFAELYLIPYNEKIWHTKTEEMGIEWIGRIPKPPVADILKSAIGIETEGYTHQLHFHYPLRGGIRSLSLALEARVKDRIVLNWEARRIRKEGQKWIVSSGSEERTYDALVSTIPLFHLVERIEGAPSEVIEAGRNLRFNSLIVALVGARQPDRGDKFAVYVPQPDLWFHRLCFMSYFGDACCPPGTTAAQVEITTRRGDGIYEKTDDEVIDHVVKGLDQEGFIDATAVCATAVQRTEYAYPIYDLDHSKNVGTIYDYLKSIDLDIAGRFGRFKYLNMDACIRTAKTVADRLNAKESA